MEYVNTEGRGVRILLHEITFAPIHIEVPLVSERLRFLFFDNVYKFLRNFLKFTNFPRRDSKFRMQINSIIFIHYVHFLNNPYLVTPSYHLRPGPARCNETQDATFHYRSFVAVVQRAYIVNSNLERTDANRL